MNTALIFAKDVMRMQRELEDLREEVERLRDVEQKYNKLLNEALSHSREMAGQVLELCMSGGTFRPERANAKVRGPEAASPPEAPSRLPGSAARGTED